ncbi:acylphosphatase [Orbus sturtevantii]|uniref:acylphosphatase n=1 Tax=Orbus sturtevantii TaxID=3074109 RepID=UPI00370D829F
MPNTLRLPENDFIQIRVSGRVQNVGFRFFTYQKARKLKLTGYVKNLINGEVEIIAGGPKVQLDLLIQWLNDGGPNSAHIKEFLVKKVKTDQQYTDFSVRY